MKGAMLLFKVGIARSVFMTKNVLNASENKGFVIIQYYVVGT